MNVRLWSPLLFSDIASAVNCASSQLAVSFNLLLFSSLYMYFKNTKPQMPQAIMMMVTSKGNSSAKGLGYTLGHDGVYKAHIGGHICS